MADSRASVLIQAAQLAADTDVDSLTALVAQHADWLRLEVVLRLLVTYLPESVEPALYQPLLQSLASWNADPDQQTLKLNASPDSAGPPQKLHLLALSAATPIGVAADDIFVRFLLDRAHRIDAETGSLVHVQELLAPYVARSEALHVWFASTVLPLLRLDYEYYPDLPPTYTLESFERLQGRSGVYSLLFELLRRNKESETSNYGRDFRGILSPWVIGEAWRHGFEKKLGVEETAPVATLWSDAFSVLLDHAIEEHSNVVSLIHDWNGPRDAEWETVSHNLPKLDSPAAHSKYIQMMLALVYLQAENQSILTTAEESKVLRRVAALLDMTLPIDPQSISLEASAVAIPEGLADSVLPIHFHHDELLEESNPLSNPSAFALTFAAFSGASRALMADLGDVLALPAVASLCLFGHTADQRIRMQKILHDLASHSATGDSHWRDARNKLLWLRQWNSKPDTESKHPLGVFGRIGHQEVEIALLKTLAGTGRFKLLTELYINTDRNIPKGVVEQVLVGVAFAAYDNASNGNKTRGGMKKASDIIATFRHQFPESSKFSQAYALIQATHALSFYQLTLQHDTPFVPANLRMHPNPVSLLDKVLEQNSQSYTKLDDLVEIGRNFVRAGLSVLQSDKLGVEDQQEQALVQIERVVTAKAIEAALSAGDFDTAYSYVVNRLSPPSSAPSVRSDEDDILWRAAYQAGRHPSTARDGPSQLRRIEQRMELLSQAVLIAPPSALQEVLQIWQSCEAEFNAQRSQAAEEEEQWNNKGDRTVPGGFTAEEVAPLPQKPRESTRRAMQEDAPMGLFDVARGAAAAFSKSAFAPSGPDRGAVSPRRLPPHDSDVSDAGRVRKRDMVSNAVTGGLVSGIGWVLGASTNQE